MKSLQTVRERLALFALLRSAGGAACGALATVLTVAALMPTVTAITTGWLVHTAVTHNGEPAPDVAVLLPPLAVLATTLVISQLTECLREPLSLASARRIDGAMRRELRALTLALPDLSKVENAQYQQEVARASERGGWRDRTPGTGAVGQLVLTTRLIGAAAATAVIAYLSLTLAIVLLGGMLFMRGVIRRQWMGLVRVYDAHAGDRRRVQYWSELFTRADVAKEIRMFGLADWLSARRRRQAADWLEHLSTQRRAILRRQGWIFLLSAGCAFLALTVPAISAMSREISLPELVTFVLVGWGVLAIGAMGHEAFDIEYGLGSLRVHHRLTVHEPAPPAALAQHDGPDPPAGPPPIRFEGVDFRYPNAKTLVLDGLDLEIPSGQVLAIVGPNGAGKTTLIKLLAGLYRPTAGRITIAGQELDSGGVGWWRRQLCVTFQDFVRYPVSAADNIGLAAPERPIDRAVVAEAARRAGAGSMVDSLPGGLDTLLSHEHEGGMDLSGGQWQQLAVARALYAVARGRHVVIMDEPTAHLDVLAETRFYRRVVGALRGVTVILISHRLSTIRNADRIALLADGKVAELGGHEQLMDLDAEYARLFRLQAQRFVDL